MKFKLFTQKIQITNFEKMAGDEAFLMTSLVLILAVFLRRRQRFLKRMRLMSLQMERMRQIVVIWAIQVIGKVLAEELRDLMRAEEL